MESGTVTTSSFRVGPGAYLRYSARSVVPRLLFAVCIPFIACLIASAWDLRWAFVALIILFLVAPMAVGYIYFSQLLTPEAQKALSPKQVTLPAPDSGLPAPDSTVTVTYLSSDEENTPPPPVTFYWSDINKLIEARKYLIIESDSLGYPLIIPVSSLNDQANDENQS